MDNTFLKVAIIGLIITNIYVIIKLQGLQNTADQFTPQIQDLITKGEDIAAKIKFITG